MRLTDRCIKHNVGELVAGGVLAKETPPDVNFNIGKDSHSFTLLNPPSHRQIEWPQKLMKSAQFVRTNSDGLTDGMVIAQAVHYVTIWKKRSEHGDGIEAAHYDTHSFWLGRSSYQRQSNHHYYLGRMQEREIWSRFHQNQYGSVL
ncbi:hypothetical protein BU17DRAFT_96493 [Hysterangium stoloniferum]|nr:hypothetical protein BU17DRAFT_96493 [Hysterangium stoloniferum]